MRIFHNNIEITKEVTRLDSSNSVLNYTSGDFIYISSDLPFNHLFIKQSVHNDVAAVMSVEYYAAGWVPVIELNDETNGLFVDGFVEFTPNKNNGWTMEPYSTNVGLTKMIYDKYWVRISFDVTLKVTTALSFIGNKFSDDTDLFFEYPIFNNANFLTAFKSGKTDWEEQHVKAAELIIADLQKKSVILGAGQILDRKSFIGASVCKVAEIIYTAFGNDYVDQKKEALSEYYKRLNLSQYSVDANNDAILEPLEQQSRQGWLSR